MQRQKTKGKLPTPTHSLYHFILYRILHSPLFFTVQGDGSSLSEVEDLVVVSTMKKAVSRLLPAFGVFLLDVLAGILLVHSSGAARAEDDEGSKEEADDGCDERPHGVSILGVASTAVPIDVSLKHAEEDQVGRHDDKTDEPGDG